MRVSGYICVRLWGYSGGVEHVLLEGGGVGLDPDGGVALGARDAHEILGQRAEIFEQGLEAVHRPAVFGAFVGVLVLSAQRAFLPPGGCGDLLEFPLGGLGQLAAFARALGGQQRVAAEDEALAGKVRRGDFGQVSLVEKRGLDRPRGRELLDGVAAQRADPVEPLDVAQFLVDAPAGDHAAVADEDDPPDAEAPAHFGDLVRERVRIGGVAGEHLDGAGAEDALDDHGDDQVAFAAAAGGDEPVEAEVPQRPQRQRDMPVGKRPEDLRAAAVRGELLPPEPPADDLDEILFNGKDLAGWKGLSKFWSVQGGSIVGQTTKENPTKGNTFLVWQGGEVSDFEFICKTRFEGNNSGVQYRSKLASAETFRVIGYQADLHPAQKNFGMLYGEGLGRGIIANRAQKVVVGADGKKNVTGEVGNV